MKWKMYHYDYDISSSGLVRRRTDKPGNPKGKLLSPSISRSGAIYYNLKMKGETRKVRVVKMVGERYHVKRKFTEKWCNAVRGYVDQYNGLYFNHASKKKNRADYLEKPMWNWREFRDPWVDYKPNGLVIGEYGEADIVPLV